MSETVTNPKFCISDECREHVCFEEYEHLLPGIFPLQIRIRGYALESKRLKKGAADESGHPAVTRELRLTGDQ